ncbi:Replication initiator protein A (plasmid) [Rubrobacter radiotolerans]|uniref:Plasmid replication initiator TrfA n=1 Tax=Rubrobacter radiotolerans TaxID=42256 RepID=A0A023X8A5_RUBRA|nr:plasmid replication initiator TrfA [Rubrobacter radiotolerans]AHY48299.1 Replication initiator protein A [Rubrobacter radiotolerans]MDX5895572.1 plasmid replication initiator TrfA [Rubrobacter radiotolerans]SMC01496.1 Replication initiator protein A [Rubrobacter radiotolerans DSM 5868]
MTLSEQANRHIVKAEGNFEDLPYFTVGNTRRADGVIEYESEIRSADGQVLKQSWTVRALSGLGLPGSLDQDVYVALLQIIDRQGEIPPDGWIGFSLYEMVQLLKRTHGGRDYQQVKRSLDRLAGTRIQSKNAFYHKDSKTFMDGTFGLLDRVQHNETIDGVGRRSEKTWVQLSDYFVSSYRSDYLKGLDVDFYYSLNSAVAKRLYRFVDKKRNRRHQWQVDIFSLRDRIPLSNYRYPSKIREKLAPAHEELTEKGFLESVTYSVAEDKTNLVSYKIRDDFSSRRPSTVLERTPENLIAVERLKAEGVWGDVAEDLVSTFGPEKCVHYCQLLPFQKKVRNRAGWLRWAISESPELDNEPPKIEVGETSEPTLLDEAADSPPTPDPEAQRIFEELLLDLGTEGSDKNGEDLGARSIWFEGVLATSLTDDSLTLTAPNRIARDYLTERFGPTLESALSKKLGRPASIEILP